MAEADWCDRDDRKTTHVDSRWGASASIRMSYFLAFDAFALAAAAR
jgi:hypothetical protein